MAHQPQREKTQEARIVELEKYVARMRIGLIAVASLILWQATSSMGLLGPVRLYATEVYASQFILEDSDQKVYGRWEMSGNGAPAQLMIFSDGSRYVRISSEGMEQRADRVPEETETTPQAPD